MVGQVVRQSAGRRRARGDETKTGAKAGVWSSKIREGGKEKGRERERRDYFITHTAMSVCSSKSA